MLLSNESILLLVGFIGIAGIIVFAISGNYEDTVQSIKSLSDQKNNKLQESIDILDIIITDDGKFTAYITLANKGVRTITITHFLDSDGGDITGCTSNGVSLGGANELIIENVNDIVIVKCVFDQKKDLYLITSNYNIIHISL